MAQMTATQRLADHLLGGNLDEYVAKRRAKGDSWRRISLDLRDDTGVEVTSEAVRGWYGADMARGAA